MVGDSRGTMARDGERGVGLPVHGNRANLLNGVRPRRVGTGTGHDDTPAQAHGYRIDCPLGVDAQDDETPSQRRSRTVRQAVEGPGAGSNHPVPISNPVVETNTHGGSGATPADPAPAAVAGYVKRD